MKRMTKQEENALFGPEDHEAPIVAKHTPGRWTALPPIGPGDWGVVSEYVNAGKNFYVATLPNGDHDEAAANARLLASAPELLEALKTLAEYADNGTPVHPGSEAWDTARAAIRKAEGKADAT